MELFGSTLMVFLNRVDVNQMGYDNTVDVDQLVPVQKTGLYSVRKPPRKTSLAEGLNSSGYLRKPKDSRQQAAL